MITPVSNNSTYSATNLKPVEVPHFKGAVSSCQNNLSKDTLVKSTNKTQNKMSADEAFDIAKEGTKTGLHIIKDTTEKTGKFLYHLVNSIYEDSKKVMNSKAANGVDIVDQIL